MLFFLLTFLKFIISLATRRHDPPGPDHRQAAPRWPWRHPQLNVSINWLVGHDYGSSSATVLEPLLYGALGFGEAY
eukprot:6193877-Pleurochrysis_carterae.AAC.3